MLACCSRQNVYFEVAYYTKITLCAAPRYLICGSKPFHGGRKHKAASNLSAF